MPISSGRVAVEVVRAESARFRHPLLLVHGLWTGSWIWRSFMPYLAHRGWESWAPSLLEGTIQIHRDDRMGQLDEVCRRLPASPIIITHDAGVMSGTMLAPLIGAPAVVAIAPLLSRIDTGRLGGLFTWPQFWRARLIGTRVAPPRGTGGRLYLDAETRGADRLLPDSAVLFRALAAGTSRLPDEARPGLLIAAARDPIVPRAVAERAARRLNWSFHEHDAMGHFPMLQSGWERLADDLHRWLVRTLGAGLLAFLDDDEDLE